MVPVEPITYDSVETFTQAIQYGALGQDPQHLQFPIALQEENSRQMNLLNRSTVGFVPRPENINDGSLSRWFPDTNPLLLFCDDGAETSNHSFFHNPTM
ncbi:hypothetical protein Fmac_006912 [Flemingia macrophylla]|uniref:Uncharacterized protein n=1 Tax=Flemingia macrophylla TaxID=520843 RepID=A0ABD1NBY1_9FABA